MSEHRLDEIVIERPRGGRRVKSPKGYKKALQKNGDEWRRCESLCRPWQEFGSPKYLSDHLGPLKRFLNSKIGKPWDDVYSELSRRLDKNSVTGLHVFSHIWDFVERYVVLIDGVPYHKANGGYIYKNGVPLGYWRSQLYIHPETGILCLAEKVQNKPDEKREDLLIIDKYHQYQKINDIWYLITLADFSWGHKPTDVVLQKQVDYWEAIRQRGRAVYAKSKHQCNKKQIKLIIKLLSKN